MHAIEADRKRRISAEKAEFPAGQADRDRVIKKDVESIESQEPPRPASFIETVFTAETAAVEEKEKHSTVYSNIGMRSARNVAAGALRRRAPMAPPPQYPTSTSTAAAESNLPPQQQQREQIDSRRFLSFCAYSLLAHDDSAAKESGDLEFDVSTSPCDTQLGAMQELMRMGFTVPCIGDILASEIGGGFSKNDAAMHDDDVTAAVLGGCVDATAVVQLVRRLVAAQQQRQQMKSDGTSSAVNDGALFPDSERIHQRGWPFEADGLVIKVRIMSCTSALMLCSYEMHAAMIFFSIVVLVAGK
jgi:hypothetical protein